MTPAIRLSLAALVLCSVCSPAQDLSSAGNAAPLTRSDLYVKLRLDSPLKVSKLKPGDQVSGKLLQDAYSGAIEVFPASSVVHLTVDGLARRRRVPNDHWPWVIKAFTPRHENYPVFRSASVTDPDGHETSLQVSLVSVSKEVEVEPKTKRNTNLAVSAAAPQKPRRELGPIVTLWAGTKASANGNASVALAPEPVTIPSGTEAKVVLLRGVSASKDHEGDSFQARLVQPVRLGSKIILPEGSVFDGKVLKSRAPRTLSRSGSIYLTFTNLTLPGGTPVGPAVRLQPRSLARKSASVPTP